MNQSLLSGLQSLTKVFETLPTLPASCPLQCCLTQSKWDSMLVYRTNTARYEGEVSPILRTVFQHFFTDCGFSIFGCLRAYLHGTSEFLACNKLTTGQLHDLFRVNQTKNSPSLTTFTCDTKKCLRLWKHFLKRCDNRNRIRQKLLNILSQISRGRGGRRSFLWK